jgi:DNA repair exonuclease SbcCD ATPase subunit
MQSTDLYFIVAAEVSVLLLVVCVFLVLQNRSLRKTVNALKERIQKAMRELKIARAQSNPTPTETEPQGPSLQEAIDLQIKITREHHESLGSNQDIVLDIEPGTPLPHRAAALRYAMLIAEKEAMANRDADTEPDWASLRERYDQLFAFNDDFTGDDEQSASSEELEQLRRELENARKRVANLEKFKNLYMDLEAEWETSTAEAKTHYDNLSQMASKLEDSNEFETALEQYNSSYTGITKIIESAADESKSSGIDSSEEVKHLRAVAADQHRIIEELQRKLKTASTEDERNEVIGGLQDELSKQMRFVQESETCIQLLEDELNTTNKELDQLRSRVGKIQGLKTEMMELSKSNDELDLKVQTIMMENRKLMKRLQQAESAPKVDTGEANKLRKELAEMEEKYNDLEEKFLDIKLRT